uniref:Pentacotripeptide-repeat region of PRORP domain-containing protein n=1 Tax=Picea sitchensis TaxID=3332 RepID=D5A837_PICSI|nr:unknown [Picea sitchensis]
MEFYTTLVQGAMIGYTPDGMEIAQDTLQKMTARGWFLNPRIGSELLTAASGETFGGFTTANYIWDTLQSRGIVPMSSAVEAYYKGLKERDIPENDPRLSQVTRVVNNLQRRFASGRPM